MTRARFNNGRWTKEEHEAFLFGVALYQGDWDLIASLVETRTASQVRTHGQKFFAKLEKGEAFPAEPYQSVYPSGNDSTCSSVPAASLPQPFVVWASARHERRGHRGGGGGGGGGTSAATNTMPNENAPSSLSVDSAFCGRRGGSSSGGGGSGGGSRGGLAQIHEMRRRHQQHLLAEQGQRQQEQQQQQLGAMALAGSVGWTTSTGARSMMSPGGLTDLSDHNNNNNNGHPASMAAAPPPRAPFCSASLADPGSSSTADFAGAVTAAGAGWRGRRSPGVEYDGRDLGGGSSNWGLYGGPECQYFVDHHQPDHNNDRNVLSNVSSSSSRDAQPEFPRVTSEGNMNVLHDDVTGTL
ncbi:unnamed protein product [Pylaiella littoralis]